MQISLTKLQLRQMFTLQLKTLIAFASSKFCWVDTEVYSELCETSKIECFMQIASG